MAWAHGSCQHPCHSGPALWEASAISIACLETQLLSWLRCRSAAHLGEYRGIMNLLRLLPGGTEAKLQVDKAIDACAQIGNLRDDIYRCHSTPLQQAQRPAPAPAPAPAHMLRAQASCLCVIPSARAAGVRRRQRQPSPPQPRLSSSLQHRARPPLPGAWGCTTSRATFCSSPSRCACLLACQHAAHCCPGDECSLLRLGPCRPLS